MSSCSSLPSSLTPEQTNSFVSFEDNSYIELVNDSLELEMMTKKEESSPLMKQNHSSMSLPRRLSLALPSPQNSDVDEPVKNTEEIVSSDCTHNLRLSLALPSPRGSDVDEPQTICDNGYSDLPSSPTPSSGKIN